MSNRSGTNYSAPTDADRRPVMLGVSTVDGITPVPLEVNPVTGQLQVSGSGSGEVIDEVPSGLINSSNTVFTTFYEYKPGTTKLYLNGIRQSEGISNDYVEESDHQTLTFTLAPTTGGTLLIDYYKL